MHSKELNLIGDWFISVSTPFGEVDVKLLISSLTPNVSGTIIGENGKLFFDNGVLSDNELSIDVDVETPISARIKINILFFDQNLLNGNIQIDDYAIMSIKGEKNVNL